MGIIYKGAEATIEKRGKNIIKNRIKKSYRLDFLDNKIRKQRTKREHNLLKKAISVIDVPKIIDSTEYTLELEFIEGNKLSDSLDNLKNKYDICREIGKSIAKLHDNNIIHGDLTTSNMILKDKQVFLIDFGLGFESNRLEDKASDLRLIKQALEAKHFSYYKEFFKCILEGYSTSKEYKRVLERLYKVEARGRYKNHI